MNTRDYIEQAIRTKSDKFYEPTDSGLNNVVARNNAWLTSDVLHAAVGISTEAGEILDVMKKAMFYGKAVDYTNLDEEMGDVLWYIAIYCNARGIGMEQLMAQNIAKLQTRYPHCFSEEAANTRDLSAERAVLDAYTGKLMAEGIPTTADVAAVPVILPMAERTTLPLDDAEAAAVRDA